MACAPVQKPSCCKKGGYIHHLSITTRMNHCSKITLPWSITFLEPQLSLDYSTSSGLWVNSVHCIRASISFYLNDVQTPKKTSTSAKIEEKKKEQQLWTMEKGTLKSFNESKGWVESVLWYGRPFILTSDRIGNNKNENQNRRSSVFICALELVRPPNSCCWCICSAIN